MNFSTLKVYFLSAWTQFRWSFCIGEKICIGYAIKWSLKKKESNETFERINYQNLCQIFALLLMFGENLSFKVNTQYSINRD